MPTTKATLPGKSQVPNGSSGVWAAFVTYASPEYASTCLGAISKQTLQVDRVVVVDNGPPGTELDLSAPVLVDHLQSGSNIGPAGGFAVAIRHFMNGDGQYLWVMDDDVIPDPSCLELQLHDISRHHNHAVVTPTLRDYRGVVHDRYGWAGQLVPRGIVEAAGPPIAEYFWGSEDSEWLLFRIRDRMRVPLVRSIEAGAQYDARPAQRSAPAWKYYYEARNGTHADLYRRPTVKGRYRVKRLAFRTGKLVGRAFSDPGGPSKRLPMIARGLVDGILGRLGINVPVGPPDRIQHEGSCVNLPSSDISRELEG